MPWIPLEHFNNLENAKTDLKTDIWAYATTIWEIFSHGYDLTNMTNPVQFFANGQRLKPPEECNQCRDIYEIMREGWDEDPDKRFSSQFVISRLAMASKYSIQFLNIWNALQYLYFTTGNRFDNPYNEIANNHTEYTYPSNVSTGTQMTVLTEEYMPMLNGGHNGQSHSSLHSSATSTQDRSISRNSGDDDILEPFAPHEAEEFQREYINKIITLDNSTITFKKLLGAGNFGQVYEGTLVDARMNMTFVALKVLSTSGKGKLNDALLEAKIMHKLDHPNIVKILMYNLDEFSNQLVIVMELMKNDSLDIYLKSNRPKIKSIRLMKFAKDIASVSI